MPCHGSSGPAGVLIHSSIHPCKLWLQVWFRTTGVLKAASSAYSAIQTNRVSDPARPQPVQPVAPSGSPCMHARASLLYLRCRSERCSLLLHFSIWVCFSRPPPPRTDAPPCWFQHIHACALCRLHAACPCCYVCHLPPAACRLRRARRATAGVTARPPPLACWRRSTCGAASRRRTARSSCRGGGGALPARGGHRGTACGACCRHP